MDSLEGIAKKFFPENSGHDFGHTLRVKRMALFIAEKEGADLEIVEAAALLHDIAREKEANGEVECHAAHAAVEAKEILKRVGFSESKIEAVSHCIAVHRASKGKKAESLEAKILQDADRLDVIGALGIGRIFYKAGEARGPMYDPKEDYNQPYRGQYNAALNHLISKGINMLKPESFNTKTGQKMAKQRHEFTKKFVKQFLAEWEMEE